MDSKLGIQILHKSTTLGIRREGGNSFFGRDNSLPLICGVARVLRHLRPGKVGPRALAGLLPVSRSSVPSLLNVAWRFDVRT